MPKLSKGSNIEVVDILFAVALGEGFMAGVYEFKDRLISAEVFTFGEDGQGFYRVVLAFLIIILSWIYYRRSTTEGRQYPPAEFVFDLMVVLAYMVLFLFVEAPIAYYVTIALIWLLYASARLAHWHGEMKYFAFGLGYASLFAAIALSIRLWPGGDWEWARLILTTAAVAAYRPIDRRIRQKILPAA